MADTHEDDFFRQLATGQLADPAREGRASRVAAPARDEEGTAATLPRVTSRQATPAEGTKPRAPDATRRASFSSARAGDKPSRRHILLVAVAAASACALVVALSLGGELDRERGSDGGTEERGRGPRAAEHGLRPAAEGPQISLWWQTGRARRPRLASRPLVLRWRRGGRVALAGRLQRGPDRPIRSARLGVLAADATRPQAGSVTVGELRTDRRGYFRAGIALDVGAARKLLTVAYVSPGSTGAEGATARARLTVKGGPR